MKKLLILPLLILLTGCVTYYYPETALEDGIYYAEDDPSYVVYQGGYPGAAYYPWSSLDYFYLGFNPYPRFTYYYGFPFGLMYGYSPWYYPHGFYGYYSPLYASYYHYPYYPGWRPYNGYCSHYGSCKRRYGKHVGNEQDRYVGNGDGVPRHRDGEDTDDNARPAGSLESLKYGGSSGTGAFRRYVSVTPSGYSGNQGMVIRSSETTKIGKSRIQPVESDLSSDRIAISARPAQTIVTSGPGTGNGPSAPVNSRGSASERSSSSSTSRPSHGSTSRVSSRSSGRSRSSMRAPSHRAPKSNKSPVHKNRD